MLKKLIILDYLLEGLSTIGPLPENVVYASLTDHVDLYTFLCVLNMAKEQELITSSNHMMTITDKGRKVHSELKEVFNQMIEELEADESAKALSPDASCPLPRIQGTDIRLN